jgi:hypothetical protein
MKIKLTLLGMGIVLMFLATSCKHKLDCPGFDLEEDIMDWYFVPSLASQINYVDSNGTSYTFNQTDYSASEAYTFKCGAFAKCVCIPALLSTQYYNLDLDFTFSSTAYYSYHNGLSLTHDSITYTMDVHVTDQMIYARDSLCTVESVDTLTVFNTEFIHVFEVNSQVDDFKFWLQKEAGIIAFETNNMMYKLN